MVVSQNIVDTKNFKSGITLFSGIFVKVLFKCNSSPKKNTMEGFKLIKTKFEDKKQIIGVMFNEKDNYNLFITQGTSLNTYACVHIHK